MDRHATLNHSEWQVMELLWQRPHTLMELVARLGESIGWSKSTVATVVRRMDDKGLITYTEQGRAKLFHPAVSQEDVAARETDNLLRRAYKGSLGLMVSAMARRNTLTQADIDALQEILRKAEEDAR